jgi:hypothetical protein
MGQIWLAQQLVKLPAQNQNRGLAAPWHGVAAPVGSQRAGGGVGSGLGPRATRRHGEPILGVTVGKCSPETPTHDGRRRSDVDAMEGVMEWRRLELER